MTKQGGDSIAESSVLVQSANDYYAVIELGSGSFAIGRFDKNLEAKAKSSVTVLPYTGSPKKGSSYKTPREASSFFARRISLTSHANGPQRVGID